jgi:Tol biopolymer transport system component
VDVGIFTVNLDGTELRRLVPFTSFDADWEPDGRRIAFTIAYGASSPDGVDVYTARSNATQLRRLTRNGRRLSSLTPAWSPDGTRIAPSSGWVGANAASPTSTRCARTVRSSGG